MVHLFPICNEISLVDVTVVKFAFKKLLDFTRPHTLTHFTLVAPLEVPGGFTMAPSDPTIPQCLLRAIAPPGVWQDGKSPSSRLVNQPWLQCYRLRSDTQWHNRYSYVGYGCSMI